MHSTNHRTTSISLFDIAILISIVLIHATALPVSQSGKMASIVSSLFSCPNDASTDDASSLNKTICIAGEEYRTPSVNDMECIQERQLEHKVQAFAVGKKCRHGFPQAFGFHPILGKKVTSGLFRLSCPLLVQAVDEWENEGAVREMSDMVRSSKELSVNYREVNRRTAAIRKDLVEHQQGGLDMLQSKLGEYNTERFLLSGIAGIPPEHTWDVKCLHAHVADHLCRCGSKKGYSNNKIGEKALQKLSNERGIDVMGNNYCWQQCDISRERMPEDWSYVPRKNRQGLRSTRKRRKELRGDISDEVDGSKQ
mmetsp:Transcript_14055/g.21469  ORF Transcript_14055/g.21469 Transcript_14055/m.21469 type:complete len:310 (-) Transcript_14055:26-955(-)